MTNDSKDLASLNKNILAALAEESKDALQKVMQQCSDSERECIELDHQKFVQELIQKYDGRLKLQAAEIEHELYQKYLAQYNDLATTLGEHRAMFLEGYAKQYELNEKNKGKPYYKILNKALEKELKTFLKEHERMFDEGNEVIRHLTVEDVKNFAEDETHITELEQEVQKHIRETTEEWDAKREEKVKEVEKRLLKDTSQDAELITPFLTPENEFTEQEDEIYIHAGEDLKIFKGLSSLSNTLSDLEIVSQKAKQGDASAQYELGNKYCSVAMQYYIDSCKTNHCHSFHPFFSKEAIYWYTKAANQGNDDAQHQLGLLYHFGPSYLGMKPNPTQSVIWLKKSAEKGNPYSKALLGDCYYYGIGVIQDFIQAEFWYIQAVKIRQRKHVNIDLYFKIKEKLKKIKRYYKMSLSEQRHLLDELEGYKNCLIKHGEGRRIL